MKKIMMTLVVAAALAGCKTTQERALESVTQAQEYIESGDPGRALVELRNALQRDENLVDARFMFADLLAQEGRKAAAFGQYVKVTELDPEHFEANVALARITFEASAWDDARKFAVTALAQDESHLPTQSLLLALNYREAQMGKDSSAQVALRAQAEDLLAQDPTLLQARRVIIVDANQNNQFTEALTLIEDGLKLEPTHRDLLLTKLAALERLGMEAELEVTLLEMSKIFPEDEIIARYVMTYYLRSERVDDAQTFLLSQIDPTSDKPQSRFTYLRFVAQSKSDVEMRDALAGMLVQDPLPLDISENQPAFEALLAGANFTTGDQASAIESMQTLISAGEPSAELDRFKIQLARMYQQTNNPVGSRALVEQVLEHDAGQSQALKMRSTWLIEEGDTASAIRLLRDALAGNPNDSQALTLLATAYQREGRTELMSEMLARAVEVSGQGSEESRRYAQFLNSQEEYLGAESVLLTALRRQPSNLGLLADLGNTYLSLKDWGRSTQVVQDIRTRFETSEGAAVANELQARVLSAQGKDEELESFLETLAEDGPLGAKISVVRNMIRQGNAAGGLKRARDLVSEEPDQPAALLLLSQILVSQDNSEEAREVLQTLTAKFPKFEQGWINLLRVTDERAATLTAGRAALPSSRALALIQSSMLESAGDLAAAEAIYEELYAVSSDDLIAANNLASVISSSRTDEASLDYAWSIAKRLPGTGVPAFMDTYGWIAFLRGDFEEARTALEEAVTALPNEPTIQYHLGRVYAEAGLTDEARTAYEAAQSLLEGGASAAADLPEKVSEALKAL